MRYYPTLLNQLKFCVSDPTVDELSRMAFSHFLDNLQSPNFKRLIFDARQVAVLDQSGELDESRREKIHPPFRKFYLELTESILLKAQEPGCQDALWSILYDADISYGTEVLDQGKNRRIIPITKVTFFYKAQDNDAFVDRTWSVAPEGYPLVGRPPKEVSKRYKAKQEDGHLSASGLTATELLPDYVKENELICVYDLEKKGWWEESIIDYTNLLYWMFAYTMAKSVKIVELPVSRQVRRACEREGRLPNPWHICIVEPKFVKDKTEYVGEGSHHSHKYDVIGFLRMNRHKLKDGSYRETFEWVSDHQRGLANELYIPKIYKVEKGRKIADKEMRKYFGIKGEE